MHRSYTRHSLFCFALLAAALVFARTAALSATVLAQPAPNHAAIANQSTPEPVETPTPLPTLTDLNSGGTPGNALLVGLMLVCVMGLMLVGGVFIAILIVRLRTRMQR